MEMGSMKQPVGRNSTSTQSPLDQFLKRLMREPTPALHRAVDLIVAEIAKRVRSTKKPPRPAPSELSEHLTSIETDLQSLIKRFSALEARLKPYPDLYQRMLYGQFGVLSAASEVHLADRLKPEEDMAEAGSLRAQEPQRREEETPLTELEEKRRAAWLEVEEQQRNWAPPAELLRDIAARDAMADESYERYRELKALSEGIKPGDYVRGLSLDDFNQGPFIERLRQTLRHATWQREHYTLDDTRPDPSADRLCAVAVVDLTQMTRWKRPEKNDPAAWALCEQLWQLSGGLPSRSRGTDDHARWERHLNWARGHGERVRQWVEAKEILSATFAKARFIALSSPEDSF
jgi:hypothetical protein